MPDVMELDAEADVFASVWQIANTTETSESAPSAQEIGSLPSFHEYQLQREKLFRDHAPVFNSFIQVIQASSVNLGHIFGACACHGATLGNLSRGSSNLGGFHLHADGHLHFGHHHPEEEKKSSKNVSKTGSGLSTASRVRPPTVAAKPAPAWNIFDNPEPQGLTTLLQPTHTTVGLSSLLVA